MKILAIETSCDDTCVALAECSANSFNLLSNVVSSQTEIHRKWGGVYPALARRAHQKNLAPVLAQALEQANLLKKRKNSSVPLPNRTSLKNLLEKDPALYSGLLKFFQTFKKPAIDLVAVTMGPGLDPCLWTGINLAKALSCAWNFPILGVNHIEGHIIANLLPQICSKSKIKNNKFPGGLFGG